MPDIELRFNKDMLVLSAPIDTALAKQGVDIESDREFLSLIEPESIRDALRLEAIAGAQCLVTNTAGITAARLSHVNMEDRALELATAALTIMKNLSPQHVLAEIGSTQLPLDPSGKTSLNQNRDQYAQAARDFGDRGFDAFFLNGMSNPFDMQCALMGIRRVSDTPLFASIDVDQMKSGGECNDQSFEEALSMMSEYGASVVGFTTGAPLDEAVSLVKRATRVTNLPLLVQLQIKKNDPKQQESTLGNPYYSPDVMVGAAVALRAEGAQFLRAVGQATPAYTGSLVAASAGFDTVLC